MISRLDIGKLNAFWINARIKTIKKHPNVAKPNILIKSVSFLKIYFVKAQKNDLT